MVERYRDEIRKNIPEVDAVVGTGELEQIIAAAGMAAPQATSNSPFRILTVAEGAVAIAPKEIIASSRGASPAKAGTARSPISRITFTTRPRRACSPLPHIPRISRLPRAATILAVSALFRNCAESSVRGVLSLSLPKPSDWRDRCPGSNADRPGHHLLRGRFRSERRPGVAAGNRRHRRSPLGTFPIRLSEQDHRGCLKPWRRTKRLQIYGCTVATRRRGLKRMKRGGGADIFLKPLKGRAILYRKRLSALLSS